MEPLPKVGAPAARSRVIPLSSLASGPETEHLPGRSPVSSGPAECQALQEAGAALPLPPCAARVAGRLARGGVRAEGPPP